MWLAPFVSNYYFLALLFLRQLFDSIPVKKKALSTRCVSFLKSLQKLIIIIIIIIVVLCERNKKKSRPRNKK